MNLLTLIWLITISIILLILLILVLIITFSLIPAIRIVLAQILKREQMTISSIQKLKMVLKFEEGVDLDEKLPFDVKIEPAEVTETRLK